MGQIQGLDHVALAVPNLARQVARFIEMGLVVQSRKERSALLVDPASGFKIELSEAFGTEAQFRHIGFRAADVGAAHAELVNGGMTSLEAPHRRESANMFTAVLKEANGLEIQLVKYD